MSFDTRRKPIEGTLESKKKCKEIIQKNPIGVVSTCNKNTLNLKMSPESSFVMVIIADDCSLYFLTKTKSRKQYNIHSYPNISIAFSDLKTFETVQIEGIATEEVDPEKIQFYVYAIRKNSSNRGRGIHPSERLEKGDFKLIKCVPYWVRYGNFGYRENQWESFEQILNEIRE